MRHARDFRTGRGLPQSVLLVADGWLMVTASSLRRHGSIKPSGRGVIIGALSPAYSSGRTMFPSRVFDPSEVQCVFKTGHQSRKIGKTVTKGPRKGWAIYTLTLEERATCP